MIEMSNLREMRKHLPSTIGDKVEAVVRETVAVPPPVVVDDIAFVGVFGSPMFIVEKVEDLAAVRSFEEGPNGRLSLLDAASEWFDIARWEEGSDYAVFAAVDSADGGPQWFVPKSIADAVPTVAASIELKRRASV